MGVEIRRYKMLEDFEKVNDFLRKNYKKNRSNGLILQPFWEYAHIHPYFNTKLTHRFGIWEDNGEIVALANYETDLGEAFLNVKDGYEYLKEDIIKYAEKELFKVKDEKKQLHVWALESENDLVNKLIKKGYKMEYQEPLTIYNYDKGLKEIKLPDGFTLITLEDENDFKKINDVLWKGFDHGDEPDDDLDCRMLMQSSPNFRKDLTCIIKAPSGEYACFCGMWVDKVNGYAYVEPLATDPKYRRLGLATYALMEAMKKTIQDKAKYCYGGSREFYFDIGFEKVDMVQIWYKEW